MLSPKISKEILCKYADIVRAGSLSFNDQILRWSVDGNLELMLQRFATVFSRRVVEIIGSQDDTFLEQFVYWICKSTSINFALFEVTSFLQKEIMNDDSKMLTIKTYDPCDGKSCQEYDIQLHENECDVRMIFLMENNIFYSSSKGEKKPQGTLKAIHTKFDVPPPAKFIPTYEVEFVMRKRWLDKVPGLDKVRGLDKVPGLSGFRKAQRGSVTTGLKLQQTKEYSSPGYEALPSCHDSVPSMGSRGPGSEVLIREYRVSKELRYSVEDMDELAVDINEHDTNFCSMELTGAMRSQGRSSSSCTVSPQEDCDGSRHDSNNNNNVCNQVVAPPHVWPLQQRSWTHSIGYPVYPPQPTPPMISPPLQFVSSVSYMGRQSGGNKPFQGRHSKPVVVVAPPYQSSSSMPYPSIPHQ